MPATAEIERMTSRKMGRPKGERDDVSAKVDRKLMAMAKLIAARRGITVAELLSEIIRVPLDREYAQLVREVGADGGRDDA